MKINKLEPSDFLKKVPTGITGFDEITGGGVPAGRPTLVCGSAGCGKSLLATEFLIRGAIQFTIIRPIVDETAVTKAPQHTSTATTGQVQCFKSDSEVSSKVA